jgi:hypothetical protein
LEAGIPVVARDDDGKVRKVDLTLEEAGDGLISANPLVKVEIPDALNSGISLATPDGGLLIEPAAPGNSNSVMFGEQNALYSNVGLDRDLLVSPIANGVELSDQLRSAMSPEQLRYNLDLPSGTTLVSDGAGGANVVNHDTILVHIPFPTAVDAQGSDVPVELKIDESALILEVEHRNRSVAYPLLVDPVYELVEGWNWNGGSDPSALSDGTWQWGSNVGWIYGSTSCIYACWGSGRGLFVSTPNGSFNGNQYGQWTYTPPGGDQLRHRREPSHVLAQQPQLQQGSIFGAA